MQWAFFVTFHRNTLWILFAKSSLFSLRWIGLRFGPPALLLFVTWPPLEMRAYLIKTEFWVLGHHSRGRHFQGLPLPRSATARVRARVRVSHKAITLSLTLADLGKGERWKWWIVDWIRSFGVVSVFQSGEETTVSKLYIVEIIVDAIWTGLYQGV